MRVAIVGAGPAGNFLAYQLRLRDIDVDVYEQFSSIGIPIQCTGLLTHDVLELLPELMKQKCVVNTINDITVTTAHNHMKVRSQEIVVDRTLFDRYLGELAQKSGAQYFFSHKFVKIHQGKVVVRNKKTGKEISGKYDVVVGADGPQSRVAKQYFPRNINPLYFGIQAVVEKKNKNTTYDTYLGSDIPKFFGWHVPQSKNAVRVGLAVRTPDAPQIYEAFVKKLRVDDCKVIAWQSGPIPIFNPKNKWYTKKQGVHLCLIGDAATQIKSTTGGGIVPHLRYGKVLAHIIAKQHYAKYTSSIFRSMNWNIYAHLFARRILDFFTNKDYDQLVTYMSAKRVQHVLEKVSRDSAPQLMTRLLIAQPKLLLFTPRIARGIFSVLTNPESKL